MTFQLNCFSFLSYLNLIWTADNMGWTTDYKGWTTDSIDGATDNMSCQLVMPKLLLSPTSQYQFFLVFVRPSFSFFFLLSQIPLHIASLQYLLLPSQYFTFRYILWWMPIMCILNLFHHNFLSFPTFVSLFVLHNHLSFYSPPIFLNQSHLNDSGPDF